MSSPRKDHYDYSHQVLAQEIFGSGAAVEAALSGPGAGDWLKQLWSASRTTSSPTGLRVAGQIDHPRAKVLVIEMPPTAAAGETMFAALVAGVEHRYFVYDRSATSGRGTLAELRPGGMRVNLGTHDGITPRPMVTAIFEELGIDPNEAPGLGRAVGRRRSMGGLVVGAFMALGSLGLAAGVGYLIYLEVATYPADGVDLKKSKKRSEGKTAVLNFETEGYGRVRHDVYLEVDGAKPDKKGKFVIKGRFGCANDEDELEQFAVDEDASASYDLVKYKKGKKGRFSGRVRLYWFDAAPGDAVYCKGKLRASPGRYKSARLVATTFQRPSDYVGQPRADWGLAGRNAKLRKRARR